MQPAAALDLSLQRACEQALGRRQGAIVALSPRDGQVLALLNPELAVRKTRPPGSVAKLVTAFAAVDAGVTDERRVILCHGPTRFGSEVRRCWRQPGHGRMTLVPAIANSCNIYFQTVGQELGAARLAGYFGLFGLGQATGIDLAGEAGGAVPHPRGLGGLLDMAFGEGPGFQTTPLQIAALAAAVANGGTLVRPWLERPQRRAAGKLPASPRARQALMYLQEGMRQAVLRGSAGRAAVPGLAVAGKTGTSSFAPGSTRTHAWFAGYAPAESPRLVLVVFLEEGTGFGSAAPVAGDVFRAWQRTQYNAQKAQP